MGFQLKLVDTNPDVCEEFEIQFEKFANIEIHWGYFEDVKEYDCMVSPANSFGMMDGGIDLAIRNYFGKKLERDVQNYIIENYFGEQPIGTSFILPTYHDKHPFLAHTPTMRIPQNIEGTKNVYYAMKGLLRAVALYNRTNKVAIRQILCPGMGTLIGEMTPYEAVGQMALAYEHFLKPPTEINVSYIYERISEIENN
jgi:O-acetyl-ADP-ribose deacetylase (regulator of RNase III)